MARKKKKKHPRPAAAEDSTAGSRIPALKVAWLGAFAVFAVSFLLYANTLEHDFVWDDYNLIVENSAVRTLDGATLIAIFKRDFWPTMSRGGAIRLDNRYQTDRDAYYRPVVTLSYHVDHRLFGGQPAGFHWMNVFWNAAVCALAFGFIYALFGSVVLAVVTGLVFAAHPVHTESVAWISGRTDVLASFWILLSLVLYVLARRRQRAVLLGASLVAGLIAMLAKEIAVCLPLVVAALELRPFEEFLGASGKNVGRPRRRKRRLTNLGLFLGVLVVYLVLRRGILGTAFSANAPFAPPGLVGQVALPLSILAGYVYKVLFPVTLTAEYTAAVPVSMFELRPLIGLVLVVCIAWAVWRFRHRADILLGATIFVFGLAPVLHVIPIGELSAERFLFFPSLGVALVLGGIFASAVVRRFPSLQSVHSSRLATWWPMSPRLANLLLAIFIAGLLASAVRTVTRNTHWETNEVLFEKTAEQRPNSPRVLIHVGMNAQKKGDIAGAIRAYEKSLLLVPDYAVPNWNLGLIRLQQGDVESARRHFERAARGGPDFAAANYHLANIEKAAGNTARAKQYAQRFLSQYQKNDQYRREAEAILRGQ